MDKNTAQSTFYTIGEAATRLGVSIDTLRRWEAAGKIAAVRRSGMRLFSAEEIARLKPLVLNSSEQLSVSQAATYLDVTPATLRRWDREGKLKPQRSLGNERVYDQDQLSAFAQQQSSTAVQPATNTPVTFIKGKATELTDTIYFTFFDTSVLQRNSKRIASTIAIGVLLLIAVAYTNDRFLSKNTAVQAAKSAAEQTEILQEIAQQRGFALVPVASPTSSAGIQLTGFGQTVALQGGTISSSQAVLGEETTTMPYAIGTSVIRKGQTSVTVSLLNFAATTKVFASTSIASTSAAITDKHSGGFTISIEQPMSSDISVDWIAVY